MSALQVPDNIVLIGNLNHGKSSAALSKVGKDSPVVALKHNEPALGIVTSEAYCSAKETEEDLDLLVLAIERTTSTKLEDCVSLDDVKNRYGIAQDEIDKMDEVEFE